MKKYRLILIFIIPLLLLLFILPNLAQTLPRLPFTGSPFNNEAYGETELQELVLSDVPFRQAATNQPYETEIFSAPTRFNAIVVEWTPNPTLFIEMRVGKDGVWDEWTQLLTSPDNRDEGGALEASNIHILPGETADYNQVQFRTWTAIIMPTLRLSFIDSTTGPDMAEVEAAQRAFLRDGLTGLLPFGENRSLANPKPSIISRDIWCTDPLCDPVEGDSGNSCVDRDELNYINVTNLVVHHTVSANDKTDWPATMRAIWKFHAFSRCWGDIGYNYLIDPSGNIYEGHRGGDNVAGTHAADMNGASMGVALLGNFVATSGGMTPPGPMLNSLVDILAWKADLENIDPYGATYVNDLNGGRPNLMGHRDVFGTTECPGQLAHELLPDIRDRVAARLDFIPERIVIDELSDNFERSNSPNWRTGIYNCGIDGNAWYTWSTTDPELATYWGEWTIDPPVTGRYLIEANIPYCNTGAGETDSALYTVSHNRGSTDVRIDMDRNVGLWVSLGEYDFDATEEYKVRLTDLTQDNGGGVWFDAIRITPLGVDALPLPDIELIAPEPETILSGGEITFTWTISDFYSPESVELALSLDPTIGLTPTNLIRSETLPSDTLSFSTTISETTDLYWQVSANGVKQGESAVQRLGIDAQPPTTEIINLFRQEDGQFLLSWNSEDDLSGVASFLLQYRPIDPEEEKDWITIYSRLEQNVIRIEVPNSSGQFEFRVRAIDRVGNIETFDPERNTIDTASISPLSRFIYAPFIQSAAEE